MLIIRGVNVYPSQVEHALLQMPELAPHYLLVVRREHTLDTLEVRVEGQPAAMAAGRAAVGALAARVRRRLLEALGVSADVSVVAPKTIERSAGKAKRVLDLRAGAGRRARGDWVSRLGLGARASRDYQSSSTIQSGIVDSAPSFVCPSGCGMSSSRVKNRAPSALPFGMIGTVTVCVTSPTPKVTTVSTAS